MKLFLATVVLVLAAPAQAQVAGGIVDDDPAIREYVLQNASGTRVPELRRDGDGCRGPGT